MKWMTLAAIGFQLVYKRYLGPEMSTTYECLKSFIVYQIHRHLSLNHDYSEDNL
jgi:hypothetical protein